MPCDCGSIVDTLLSRLILDHPLPWRTQVGPGPITVLAADDSFVASAATAEEADALIQAADLLCRESLEELSVAPSFPEMLVRNYIDRR